MRKFGRNYLLTIETVDGKTLVVEPPFTVEFDITRNILTSANVCSIRVFNLSKDNRNQLVKNISDYEVGSGYFRDVILEAGYGDNLSVIFSGSITQAWSVREGVDFITQIESFDGGFAFATGVVNKQFPEGTDDTAKFDAFIAALPGIKKGAIGNFTGVSSRGNSYSGSPAALLHELSGGAFFIDNGKAHILGDSECLEGEIAVINSDSGLLGTPIRERTVINFDMMFEPRLTVGQLIRLESSTAGDNVPQGNYKVVSIKHRGMISEAVCGNAVTTAGLFATPEEPTVVSA